MYLKFILKRQKKCMSAFGNTSFLIENHFAYIFSTGIINNGNFVGNAWFSPIFDVALYHFLAVDYSCILEKEELMP